MSFLAFFGKTQENKKNNHPKGHEQTGSPSRRLMLALEPRYLYDAAALVTAADVLADSVPDDAHNSSPSAEDHSLWSHEPPSFFPPPALAPADDTQATEIIFVDTSVENYQQLINDISSSAQVVILDAGQDGIAQMTSALADVTDIQAIHILSHGVEGQIVVGNSVLSADNIDQYNQMLSQWDTSLTADADILLYGCNVAAGDSGIDFISRLADFTEADVAASNDLTGDADKGGDWDFEVAVGEIEAGIVFAESATAGFDSVLVAPTLTGPGVDMPGITEDATTPANTGQSVSNILNGDFNDGDADPAGIAIYASNNQNGAWQFSTDAGVSWTSIGTVSDTSALLLRGGGANDDLIRFLPDGNNAPSINPEFSYYAWDQSSGIEGIKVDVTSRGGSTAFSLTGNTADITVTDVNDAPVLDNSGTMSFTAVDEDDANPTGNTVASILASAGGDRVTDVDSGDLEGIAITGVSGSGIWEYNIGGGWLAIGAVNNGSARVLHSDALIRLVPAADYSGTLDPAITFRAWDRTTYANAQDLVDTGAGGLTTPFSANDETASLVVNPTNDAPTLNTNAGLTVNEDTGGTITNAELAVSDVDNTAVELVFTVGSTSSMGVLKNNGVTLAVNDTFTQDDIDNNRLTYTPNTDENGADSFSFTVSDGVGGTIASSTFNLNITPVNDAPTLDLDADNSSGSGGNNYQITYSEGQAATSIADIDVDLVDVDSTAFAHVTLNIAGLLDGDNERMVLDSTTFNLATPYVAQNTASLYIVTVTPGAGTAAVVITRQAGGNFSEAEIETLIQAVQYQHADTADPSDGNRTIGVTVNDTVTDSLVATTTINVNPVNDVPTIANLGGTITFGESDAALLIDTGSDAVVADDDNTSFASVKLVYTNLQDGNNERLDLETVSISLGTTGVTPTATYSVSVTASGSSATVIITKAGNFANAGEVDTLIHLLKYDHVDDDNPTDGDRTVDITVNDGTSDSDASTVTINVNPVNDDLVLGINAGLTLNEDATSTITTALLQYTDVDNTTSELIYTVATVPTKGELQKSGVTLNALDTFTQADIDGGIITFVTTADATLADNFTFNVTDGTAIIGPDTFSINITPINDAPTLDLDADNSSTATGNDYQFTFTEGDGATNIADGDADLVDIDSTTFADVTLNFAGLLDGNNERMILDGITFNLATSYVAQNTDSLYTVTVTPGAGTAAVVITKQGGGDFIEAEAETLIKAILYQHVDTDNPTDGNRTVGITVNDGALDSVVATTIINVDPVNDAPTLPTNLGLTLTEDNTATITTAMLQLADVDNSAAELTYMVGTVPTRGVLQRSGVTLNSGSTFTQADIDAGIITFVPNTDESGGDSFTFTVSDGAGGTIGSTTFNITINPGNDAPVLDNSGAMVLTDIPEDETAPSAPLVSEIIASAGGDRITDPDSGAVEGIAVTAVDNSNGSWEYRINAGAWVAFSLDVPTEANATVLAADARIRFLPTGDFNGTATITFRAWDQTSDSDGDTGVDTTTNGDATAFSVAQETAQITVTPVNDAPVLTAAGPTLTTISEDDVGNGGQLVSLFLGTTITDPDGGSELEGIAIYNLNDNGYGAWEYNTGSGWTAIGAVNAGSALLLGSTDSIRFNPSSGTAGTADITYYAWDQSVGTAGTKVDANVGNRGGINPYSTANDTATITISAVNDAPVLAADAPTLNTIDENATTNGGELISAIVGTTITDPDGGSEPEGVAIYYLASGNGTWQYSVGAGAWTTVGSVSSTNALLLASTDKIRFVPDGDNDTTASFAYYAWDQSAGISGTKANALSRGGSTAFSLTDNTASITVTPVNDAPVLDNSGSMSLTSILEDATAGSITGNTVLSIISSAGGNRITDVDLGAVEGFAVTSVDNSNGTWQYSTDGGTSWTAFGALVETSARLLDSSAMIRFVPNGDFSGTASITFRAWDQDSGANGGTADASSNGGSTAFSISTETASITVTSVNDAPVLDNSGTMTLTTITEDTLLPGGDTVANIILTAGNMISDPDGGAEPEGIAVHTADNSNGTWQFSTNGGGSWSAIGPVSSVSALLLRDTDLLRFVPDGENADSASLDFYAWDQSTGSAGAKVDASSQGGSTAFSVNSENASITVTAANDAPVLTVTGGFSIGSMLEEESGFAKTVAEIITAGGAGLITDVDSGAVQGLAIIGVDNSNGTWRYHDGTWHNFLGSESTGQAVLLSTTAFISFVPNTDFNGTATITFRAWDTTVGSNGDSGVDTSSSGGTTAFSAATDTFSVTVTNVNDAPTLTPAAPNLTGISEDDTANSGSLVSAIVGASITDVDGASEPEGVAIYNLNSGNGTWEYNTGSGWVAVGAVSTGSALLLGSTDSIRFVPDGQNSTTADFNYYAWDQSTGSAGSKVSVLLTGGSTAFSSATDLASITVSAVNDAPSLTPILPSFTGITEDDTNNAGDTVATIVGASISDVDSVAVEGLAIYASTATDGYWEYNIGSGWTTLGSVSSTSALLLDANDFIRFVPDGGLPPAVNPTISYYAWDQTVGSAGSKVDVSVRGTTTAYSIIGDIADITVSDLNDAPVLDNSGDMVLTSIDEDIVDAANIGNTIQEIVDSSAANGGNAITDIDGGATEGVAIVGVTNTNGTWQYKVGVGAWTDIPLGVADNNALVLDAAERIRFVPSSNYNGIATGGITFRAWDTTAGGASGATGVNIAATGNATAYSTATETAAITVNPVNDAPVISNLDGDLVTFNEGGPAVSLDQGGDLVIADAIDSPVDFNGGNLTVAFLANCTVDDRLTVANIGILPGEIGVSGSNITYGGSVIGIWTGGNDGSTSLVITFNSANATPTAITALAEAIRFDNGSANPGSTARTIRFTVDDGDGGVSTSIAADVTVNMSVIDDTPTLNLDVDDSSGAGGNNYAFTFTEGDVPTNIADLDIDLADIDSTTFADVKLSWAVLTDGDNEKMILDGSTFDLGTTIGATDTIGTAYTVTITADTGADTAAVTITKYGGGNFTEIEAENLIKAIQYQHADTGNPTDGDRTVAVTVNDGNSDSAAATTTINVNPVNDAPSFTGSATLAAVPEDTANPAGDTITNLFGALFSDVDAGSSFGGLAVMGNTANAGTEGVWQYSSNGGTNWMDIGAVADDGTAVALSTATLVRFVPVADYDGAVPGLTVRAIDDTYGAGWSDSTAAVVNVDSSVNGGATAIAVGTDTIDTSITAVNDAPSFTGNATLAAVNEDTASPAGDTITNLFGALFSDPDTGSSLGGIAVMGNTANAGTEGAWQYSSNGGTNWMDIGAVADDGTAVALSTASLVRFVPVADYNGTPPVLTVRAIDDTYVAGWSDSTAAVVNVDSSVNGGITAIAAGTDTIDTSITAVNDAPSFTGNATLAAVTEDTANPVGDTITNLFGALFSDVDAGSSFGGLAVMGNTANAGTEGVWQYSSNGGTNWMDIGAVADDGTAVALSTATLVRFVPVADYDGAVPGLTVRAIDDTYGAGWSDSTAAVVNVDSSVNGGITAIAVGTDTIDTSITAVNDAPSFTGNAILAAVTEDTANPVGDTITNLFGALFSDVDAGSSFGGLAVMGNTANAGTEGAWQYSSNGGTNWMDIGAVADDGTAVALSTASLVRFVPVTDYDGAVPGLTVRAIDDTYGAGWSDSTAAVVNVDSSVNGGATAIAVGTDTIDTSITAVNDAPSFTGNATLAAVNEDTANPAGDTVTNLFGALFSDVDTGSFLGGIAVMGNTANAGTEGAWQYSSNGGTNWMDIGAVADDGTAVALSTASLVRFVPVADYNGTPSVLTVRAIDDTYAAGWSDSTAALVNVDSSVNGGITAIAVGTDTIDTSITAVNDAPSFTGNATLAAVNEDTANPAGDTITNLFGALFSDVDTGSSFGGVAVIGNTANVLTEGSWQFSTDGGTTWMAISVVGDDGTAVALSTATLVRFLPVTDYNGTPPSLTVRAIDNTYGAGWSDSTAAMVNVDSSLNGGSMAISGTVNTIDTSITAINDAPSFTANATLAAVNEDTASPVGDTITNLFGALFSDIDAGSSFGGVAVMGNAADAITEGAWQYSTDSGTTWMDIGVVADDVTAVALSTGTLVRFVPVADYNGAPPSLAVRAIDDTYAAAWSDSTIDVVYVDSSVNGTTTAISGTTNTIDTTITPVNDPPLATNLTTTSFYAEDALSVPITDIVVSDPDIGEIITATLTLQNVNTGVLTANDGASYDTISGIWIISDTVANVNTALAGLEFLPATDNDVDTTISVNIADGGEDGAGTQTGTITLDVTPSQDAPTSIDSSVSIIQNVSYTFAVADFNFSDVDTGDTLNQVEITTLPNAAHGELTTLNGLAVAALDTVPLADIVAGYLVFTPFTDYMGVATFDFRVSDGMDFSVAAYAMTVNVTNANAPVLTAGGTLNYTENDPATVIDTSLFVADNNDEITSALISISTGYNVGEDELSFTDTADITGSWNALAGQLTLTSVFGTATVADYQAALRSVTYVNLLDNPIGGNRTISFEVTDNDGAGPYTSLPVTSTVVVTAVNDAPLITAGGTLNYQEDDTATAIDSSIDISDVDSTNLLGATITISGGYINDQDVLGFTDTANISGSWDAVSGVLTLSGTDTVVAYRNALRSVTYVNIEVANPFAGNRIISYQVSDATDNSTAVASTVNVTPVNDAPTVAAGATMSYTEGDLATAIDGTILLADVDSTTLESATIRITGGYIVSEDTLDFTDTTDTANITGSWDGAGTLTLTGTDTVAAYQAALRAITYQNSNGLNPTGGNRAISFEVNDGTDASVPATSTVAVTSVNDLPLVNTSAGTLTFTEGDSATIVDSALTLSDNDSSTLTGATVTIGPGYVNGEDVLVFVDTANIGGSWSAATGILTLTGTDTIAAYQAALRSITFDNTVAPPVNPATGNRTISFVVNDGTDNSLAAARTVDVQYVDDPPAVTNMDAAESFTEDGAAFLLSTIVITDADSANVTATLTLSDLAAGFMSTGTSGAVTSTFVGGVWSASGALADVNTLLGSINFTPAVDYDSNFTIATQVSDGTTTISGSKAITVTPVNDDSVLPVNVGLTVNEGATIVIDNTMLQATDVDSMDTLTFTVQAVPANGSLLHNGVALSATDTFTQDDIDAGLLTYIHDGSETLIDSFQFAGDDGVVPSPDFTGQTFSITVTAVNDSPSFTADATMAAVNEDTANPAGDTVTNLFAGLFSDVDVASSFGGVAVMGNTADSVNEGVWQYSSDGGTNWMDIGVVGDDNTAVALSAASLVRFVPVGDYNGTPPSLTVCALDDTYAGGWSDSTAVSVNVDSSVNGGATSIAGVANSINTSITAVNDAPVLAPQSPTLSVIVENDFTSNGDSVASIIVDNSIIDVDTTPVEAIAIVGVNNVNGTWQYKVGAGAWTNISVGVADNNALVLDATERIRFVPDGTHSNTATITFRAWDKTDGSIAGTYVDTTITTAFSTVTDTATIRVDDIPVLISGSTSTIYTENNVPVQVEGIIAITDGDDTTLQGATVSITAGYDQANDVLHYTPVAAISASWDAAAGVLTLTGTASLADYQTALQSITFEAQGDNPAAGNRTISFTVKDGYADSLPVPSSTVTVVAVNDAPLISDGGSQNYLNATEMVVDADLTLSDPDNVTLTGATVAIGAGYVRGEDVLTVAQVSGITASWDDAGGVLTLSGPASVDDYQAALRSVNFANSENYPTVGMRTISFMVTDGSLQSTVALSTINVAPIMPASADQALQPPMAASETVIPEVDEDEEPGTIISGLLDDELFPVTQSIYSELDNRNSDEPVGAVVTGQDVRLAEMYGVGEGDNPSHYLAGVDDQTVDLWNREIDRLLDQLSDDNLPTPPELFLESLDESIPDKEITEVDLTKEGDQDEQQERKDLKEGVEAAGEEVPELIPEEQPEVALPGPITVAPGLAEQISQVSGNFEQGRQQLAASPPGEAGPQVEANQAEINKAFQKVYEMLQCQ